MLPAMHAIRLAAIAFLAAPLLHAAPPRTGDGPPDPPNVKQKPQPRPKVTEGPELPPPKPKITPKVIPAVIHVPTTSVAFEANTNAAKVGGLTMTTGTFTGTGQPPPPPPMKGWPHTINTANGAGCSRNPAANEVIVFKDPNFAGACAILVAGFYPFPENFLVGNDSISSIKVGTAVRARAFQYSVYGGDWNLLAPGTVSGGLGPWNDKITSFRIEPANRSETCDDIKEGEIAFYENSYMHGDCVVLPADTSYSDATAMGIENDSISSIKNISGKQLTVFWDTSFSKPAVIMPPHTLVNELPGDGFLTEGINDNISSAQLQ